MPESSADGITQQPVTDAFVQEHAVPADDAESFCHIGLDNAYHPTGGYWFPTDLEHDPDQPGTVATLDDLPKDELVQYPCDDRPPEITGGGDLPDLVANLVLEAEADADA